MRRSVVWGLALSLTLGVMRPATEAGAAPTVISNCTTITTPGSFVLSKNLTPTKGDRLAVAADFVTIDFAGFAIVGNNTGDGVTDLKHAPPHRGIVIRNGTVENCKRGVYLANSIWSVVEGMRVIGNSDSGIIANTSGVVLGNVVSGNGSGEAIGVSNGKGGRGSTSHMRRHGRAANSAVQYPMGTLRLPGARATLRWDAG